MTLAGNGGRAIASDAAEEFGLSETLGLRLRGILILGLVEGEAIDAEEVLELGGEVAVAIGVLVGGHGEAGEVALLEGRGRARSRRGVVVEKGSHLNGRAGEERAAVSSLVLSCLDLMMLWRL
jgi:hypothetical protein